MNLFEEIHKLNGIEYAVRQIEAMVEAIEMNEEV